MMRAGKLFPIASGLSVLASTDRTKRVETIGEFRPPMKGEWYISGAIPEAYRAGFDLSTSYDIGRLVTVEVITTERVIDRF